MVVHKKERFGVESLIYIFRLTRCNSTNLGTKIYKQVKTILYVDMPGIYEQTGH